MRSRAAALEVFELLSKELEILVEAFVLATGGVFGRNVKGNVLKEFYEL
jgi:hypothetical protein